MPVWADTGNPPGPLNYRQVDELIAFIRATSDETFVVKDPALNEPVIDPETGEEKTFNGWRDPNYAPAPGATPFPDCYLDAIGGGASQAPGRLDRPGRAGRDGLGADGRGDRRASTRPSSTAPADIRCTLEFDNEDPVQHNVVINDPDGNARPDGRHVVLRRARRRAQYTVAAARRPVSTRIICQVHPTTMTGTLTVE